MPSAIVVSPTVTYTAYGGGAGGTNNGGNPTTDPMDLDPKRTISAYTIDVGGSDTLKKLKVIR